MAIARILYLLLLIVVALPAQAAAPLPKLSNETLKAAQSALYFAGKEEWADARAHARKSPDPAVGILVSWLEYRSKGSGASFESITDFITQHPDWPDIPLLEQRAEEAITLFTAAHHIANWFSSRTPATGDGLKALALAEQSLAGEGDKRYSQADINDLLRQAWIKGNFGTKEEQEFLVRYGNILKTEDHAKRIDNLLWQEKIEQAERIFPNVSSGHQTLFRARIALLRNKKTADALVREVQKPLRSDPGLLYDRITWNNEKGNSGKAGELLRYVPPSPPYPHKWWVLKNDRIRQLLKERQYKEAYRLAIHHGHEKGEDFAEAEWLSGWISLSFLKKPDQAYKHFYALYQGVRYPVSLARGAYWAGRAAEANGNKKIATEWYQTATKYQDSFYGQLALLKLQKNPTLSLPALPAITASDTAAYLKNNLVKAAYLTEQASKYDVVKKLLKSAVTNAKTPGEIRLISEFGLAIDRSHIAVETAKHAARNGITITPLCYPLFGALPDSSLEDALALAIIRQESSFDKNAESPAGALGLMQLMPATAAHVAKKLRLGYADGLLTSDHMYNITLGSHYLAKLINQFDGSYVLAIAAYNGGQGNVRKWLREYGDPRQASSPEEVIDWVELIPFSETRNYVARVLEGVQIYRHQLTSPNSTNVQLHEDLLQGKR